MTAQRDLVHALQFPGPYVVDGNYVWIEQASKYLLVISSATPSGTPGAFFHLQRDATTAQTILYMDVNGAWVAVMNPGVHLLADAGTLITALNVEDALQEAFQHIQTAQAFIPISLMLLRETSNLDVGNLAAHGGILASDSTPILEAINAATDGCQRVHWAASDNDQVTFQTALPPDLDVSADVVLHARAAMAGTTDTPTVALASYFNEADTAVADATAAITGTAFAEYTATVAATDVPTGAQTLTVGLTPGAHTTDALYLTALWIEYTRLTLTS